MPNQWLSTAKAAEHLGVSKGSLYMLVCLGAIHAYRPTPGARSLRFKVDELDAYLESVRVEPDELLHLLDDNVREQLRRMLDEQAERGCNGEGCADTGPRLDDVDLEHLDPADAISN